MNFQLCDLLRIDHFRGLDAYFSIPADSPTALTGHWEPGPGIALFHQMWQNMGYKPVIVEDLGYMTDSVRALVRETGFPNMKVLQFGFDVNDLAAANDYLPHNIPDHCFVYPGTHDNDPINGWFAALPEEDKALIRGYYGCESTPEEQMNQVFVRSALMCRAEGAVISVQDWLGLGHEARINDPSHQPDNWFWRLGEPLLTAELAARIFELTRRYGRLNWENEYVRNVMNA